jgi:hypothetical protein
MLSNEEKEEFLKAAGSESLREDLRRLKKDKYSRLFINGTVDLDRLVIFLSDYNAFINHARRPLRKIESKLNKL